MPRAPSAARSGGGHQRRRWPPWQSGSKPCAPLAGAGTKSVWGKQGAEGVPVHHRARALYMFYLQGQRVRLLLPPGHHLDQHS